MSSFSFVYKTRVDNES